MSWESKGAVHTETGIEVLPTDGGWRWKWIELGITGRHLFDSGSWPQDRAMRTALVEAREHLERCLALIATSR